VRAGPTEGAHARIRDTPRAPHPQAALAHPAAATAGAVRFLNLHEYQSKDLMEAHGVTVQRGKMASTPAEAAAVAAEILKSNPKAELILKAQIHAGGRGKGHFDNGFKGGVKICTTCVWALQRCDAGRHGPTPAPGRAIT
jgi:hypothetical protein